MALIIDDSKITIYFCIPNKFLKKIQVSLYANVECLLNIFNENNKDYIHFFEGNVVDCKSSFEEIGISNEKVLYALKKCNTNDELNNRMFYKMLKLSNDKSFENKLKNLTNKSIKNEYSRISDIEKIRMEENSKLYKRKIRKMHFQNQEEQNNDVIYPLDDMKQIPNISEPNSKPMPVLW